MIDFQKLIAEVKTQYKPQCDYSALPHVVLISVLVIADFLSRKCTIRILSHRAPDLSDKDVAGYADRLVRNLNPEYLAFLYQIHPHKGPLSFLVELDCNIRDIVAEMNKRIEPFALSRVMVALDARRWEQSRIKSLLKHLHIEDIGVYDKKKRRQDTEDLQGIGLAAAVEQYSKLKFNAIGKAKGFRNPSLPEGLNIPGPDKPPWDIRNPWLFTKTLEDAIRGLLPALQGEVETLRHYAYQGLRDDWEKSEAQKRTGEEVDLQEGERILRREGRINDSFEKPEVEADISARMWGVLKEAQKHKRWGNKAIKAFKYYLEGKTEKEASELVGIDARTFRNYIYRLNKIFTFKK